MKAVRFILPIILLLASCSVPAQDAEGEVGASLNSLETGNKAGSQFVSVSAEGPWSIAIDPACDWARLSAASGSGDGHVVLSWDANTGDATRSLTIVVSTPSGKNTATCTFSQLAGSVTPGPGPSPTPEGIVDEPFHTWLELPAVYNDDRRYFITHDMTISGSKVRNYSFDYDVDAMVAVWVAYPLNKGLIGSGSRTNAWGLDPKVPQKYQSVVYSAYKGYERGHQLPSADRYSANASTFYGTNMTPQRGELNEKAWATLEGYVRTWSNQFDTLYVVTGADIRGTTEYAYDNDGKRIAVPVGYFKALLGYKKNGTMGIAPTTGGYTAIGFYFEHKYYTDGQIMQQAMTVRELEKKTGFEFFVNLPAKITPTVADRVLSTRDTWWK